MVPFWLGLDRLGFTFSSNYFKDCLACLFNADIQVLFFLFTGLRVPNPPSTWRYGPPVQPPFHSILDSHLSIAVGVTKPWSPGQV